MTFLIISQITSQFEFIVATVIIHGGVILRYETSFLEDKWSRGFEGVVRREEGRSLYVPRYWINDRGLDDTSPGANRKTSSLTHSHDELVTPETSSFRNYRSAMEQNIEVNSLCARSYSSHYKRNFLSLSLPSLFFLSISRNASLRISVFTWFDLRESDLRLISIKLLFSRATCK